MKLPILDITRATHVGSTSATPVEAVSGFAMLPNALIVDERLKHIDVHIYGVLVVCRKGARVNVGIRLIARYAGTSQRRVIDSLRKLAECGYIEKGAVAPRARARVSAEVRAVQQGGS